MKEVMTIKVASKSEPKEVAGMVANLVKEEKNIEIQAIGAGAVNQAVKSVAVARGYVAPMGINLSCIPAFANVDVEGETRTGIKLVIVY